MKTLKLCVAIIVLAAWGVSAQTTMEEYIYFSKYYFEDLETGRDVKSGYEVERFDRAESRITVDDDGVVKPQLRTIHLYSVKKSEDSSKVAIIVEILRRDTKNVRRICLPSNKSDINILNKSQIDFFKIRNSDDLNCVADFHQLWNALTIIRDMYFEI
jgi:hypothetical protein